MHWVAWFVSAIPSRSVAQAMVQDFRLHFGLIAAPTETPSSPFHVLENDHLFRLGAAYVLDAASPAPTHTTDEL